MAIRTKTVYYPFRMLTPGPSANGGTYNTLPSQTIYIPESNVTFLAAAVDYSMTDRITATGSSPSSRTFELQLGSVAYNSSVNNQALNNSGENMALFWSVDYTSYFATNWTGTSMVCNTRFAITQSGGTTPGYNNCCAILKITYSYNDSSVIQVKSVRIPLNTNTGIMTATGNVDTIPALSNYLPEANKTFRNISLCVQGNEARGASTTDLTMYANVGTVRFASDLLEGALASNRFIRWANNITSAYPNTSASQNLQFSATGNLNHMQAWMDVTYEFDAANTTSCMNSVMLPFYVGAPIPPDNITNYRADFKNVKLNIQEPGPITASRCAAYFFYDTDISLDIVARMRTDSAPTPPVVTFTGTLTPSGEVFCGSCAGQINPNSSLTLVRGTNQITFEMYKDETGIAYEAGPVSGFFVVNYTSNISPSGIGSHNRTIYEDILLHPAASAASLRYQTAGVAPNIPETEYYISDAGIEYYMITSGTGSIDAVDVQVERKPTEVGGFTWEKLHSTHTVVDSEIGARYYYIDKGTELYKHWPNDPKTGAWDIETARRYRFFAAGASQYIFASHLITYHNISYTISGNVSGSNGGTINIAAYQTQNANTKIGSTSRTGDGSYTITWYDNTVPIIVSANEDSTHKGVSNIQVAGNSFDISLASGGGGSSATYYAFL